MLRTLILLSSLVLLLACGPEPTPAQRYPGPWHEDVYPALLRAMLLHDVHECGYLAYKPAADNSAHPNYPELLVYCSNGERETAYTVFLRPNENDDAVNGPSDLYPDISPPASWKNSN